MSEVIETTAEQIVDVPTGNDLMAVTQLPVITEQLESLTNVIKAKVDYALSLSVTEESYREIKSIRADLNADYNDLEQRRKTIKKAINAPYEAFEDVYKRCVTQNFKLAIDELGSRISEVEAGLKEEKKQKVLQYFNEYCEYKNIDFVSFDSLGLKINMSGSLKSLKTAVTEFIDRVSDDLEMIKVQEHSADILVEYKKSLNVSQAILTVQNRIKAIEAEKAMLAEREAAMRSVEEAAAKVDEVLEEIEQDEAFEAPEQLQMPAEKQVEEAPRKKYTVAFKYSTYDLNSIREIKNIMERNGEYEQL